MPSAPRELARGRVLLGGGDPRLVDAEAVDQARLDDHGTARAQHVGAVRPRPLDGEDLAGDQVRREERRRPGGVPDVLVVPRELRVRLVRPVGVALVDVPRVPEGHRGEVLVLLVDRRRDDGDLRLPRGEALVRGGPGSGRRGRVRGAPGERRLGEVAGGERGSERLRRARRVPAAPPSTPARPAATVTSTIPPTRSRRARAARSPANVMLSSRHVRLRRAHGHTAAGCWGDAP